MKKLVIIQDNCDTEYKNEIECCLQLYNKTNEYLSINIKDLNTDYLIDNDVQVVISNWLPIKWYNILNRLNIVIITLDNSNNCKYLSDIVIDHKSKNYKKYFIGSEYSICNNLNDKIEFSEISDLVKKLEWDSNFFNLNISYLSCRHLTDNIIYQMESFIIQEKIDLVEYLCNCHDKRSVILAEKNQFHFTDIRLTFEKKLSFKKDIQIELPYRIGLAKNKHINDLKTISSNIYRDSRYYFDGKFENKKINEFYQLWVEKAVFGTFDHECYCIFYNDEVVGFCTVRYHSSKSAQIGLVGMSDKYQGKGLALSLLDSVTNKLYENKIEKIYVVTQGRNYSAQRIYQKAGFLTKSTELWYHKWI